MGDLLVQNLAHGPPSDLVTRRRSPFFLLERIIEVSSTENDIVLDAFCGSGTALVAAQNLKRQWIRIDVSPTACRVVAKRLRDVCGLPEDTKLWKSRGFGAQPSPVPPGALAFGCFRRRWLANR